MSHWSWFSCTHWPVDKQQAPLSPAPRGSRPASEPDSCAMAVPTGQANEAHKATIITIRCIPHPRTFPGPTTPHPRDAGARVLRAIFPDISRLSTVTYELIHIFSPANHRFSRKSPRRSQPSGPPETSIAIPQLRGPTGHTVKKRVSQREYRDL